MPLKVFILVTVVNSARLKASTMVFSSIREGFPMAEIRAFVNGSCEVSPEDMAAIRRAALKADAIILPWPTTIHHEWVEEMTRRETESFVVCDTDIVFFQSVEWFKFDKPLAGRLIPKWYDRHTNAITMPRLHGSLLFIDPIRVWKEIQNYHWRHNVGRFNPAANLFNPLLVPYGNGQTLFFDTASFLYHAIGGTPFTEAQLDCYDHLNCGTWVDEVAQSYPEQKWGEKHEFFYDHPEQMKGLWRVQEKFYQKYAV